MVITEKKFWEKINKVSKDDILTMITDYAGSKIAMFELADRIEKRCFHTFAELQVIYEKELILKDKKIGELQDSLSIIHQHSSDDWVTNQAKKALDL
jgi:hypothetical protein